jgi:asparagine N-glycosylation enzyme membrane subunit Stt3
VPGANYQHCKKKRNKYRILHDKGTLAGLSMANMALLWQAWPIFLILSALLKTTLQKLATKVYSLIYRFLLL